MQKHQLQWKADWLAAHHSAQPAIAASPVPESPPGRRPPPSAPPHPPPDGLRLSGGAAAGRGRRRPRGVAPWRRTSSWASRSRRPSPTRGERRARRRPSARRGVRLWNCEAGYGTLARASSVAAAGASSRRGGDSLAVKTICARPTASNRSPCPICTRTAPRRWRCRVIHGGGLGTWACAAGGRRGRAGAIARHRLHRRLDGHGGDYVARAARAARRLRAAHARGVPSSSRVVSRLLLEMGGPDEPLRRTALVLLASRRRSARRLARRHVPRVAGAAALARPQAARLGRKRANRERRRLRRRRAINGELAPRAGDFKFKSNSASPSTRRW